MVRHTQLPAANSTYVIFLKSILILSTLAFPLCLNFFYIQHMQIGSYTLKDLFKLLTTISVFTLFVASITALLQYHFLITNLTVTCLPRAVSVTTRGTHPGTPPLPSPSASTPKYPRLKRENAFRESSSPITPVTSRTDSRNVRNRGSNSSPRRLQMPSIM